MRRPESGDISIPVLAPSGAPCVSPGASRCKRMEISALGGFWFLQCPVRCLGGNALKTALGEVLADSAEKAAPNREGLGGKAGGQPP